MSTIACVYPVQKNKEKGIIFKLYFSQNETRLESPHPSPFSANRGFFGCNHFIKTNDYLKDNGLEPIDWKIENI